MKIGIKEFRERLSEIARGGEVVDITNHGRIIGTFTPRVRDADKMRAAAESIRRWQEDMKATGVDLEAELAALGLDPWGEPLDARA
ncbi:hypothetical protein [Sphingomonas japonica]|uniref:Antitoxin (DNA-binding transcriptional repressor) of toxin-antitoxin stability system n=1 Tax=Sphingomonas japonica TaxID=511662 RepID=A0ABX0U442_9SPHN|nr:hypothetical protein [Sphingomonas japonica]NIJ24146.1 antitoxin (DNA-binding transcriptional repressor) of toxin-antitoxin stability system [Sphingomonas japonica]